MKQIKFRAWYKGGSALAPQMVHNVHAIHDGYDLIEKKYLPEADAPYIENFLDVVDDSYFIVEQFTGLHDKHGTPIFEGDLVNAGYRNLDVVVDGKPRIVQMGYGSDSDGWAHDTWYGWKAGESSLADVHKECTVIGNIHEHPDLLKEVPT